MIAPREGLLGELYDLVAGALPGWRVWILELLRDHLYLVGVALLSVIRATGVTVQSGTNGLLFSFGRARAVLQPGFRPLLPFLQVVRTIPTRQRTMDLPAQRVTTRDGLVWLVDASLVYRVTDVRKALIEIDDLAQGMRQMLVVSVQEVLRDSERAELRGTQELDARLALAMAPRLAPWGVEIERAGFTSVTPSPKTVLLTQLAQRVGERSAALERAEAVLPRPLALALLGTSRTVRRRARLAREREILARRGRRVLRLFRRALPRLRERELDARSQARLRRELMADAGLGGVLGDAGFGHAAAEPDATRGGSRRRREDVAGERRAREARREHGPARAPHRRPRREAHAASDRTPGPSRSTRPAVPVSRREPR